MATCKCNNGHTWITKILEDDPTTNCTTVDEAICPECGSDNFEIIEVEEDYD